MIDSWLTNLNQATRFFKPRFACLLQALSGRTPGMLGWKDFWFRCGCVKTYSWRVNTCEFTAYFGNRRVPAFWQISLEEPKPGSPSTPGSAFLRHHTLWRKQTWELNPAMAWGCVTNLFRCTRRKKKRRKRHTMPLCMDFFFGILDVSKCPTCADISRAHLCHVAGWWGKRSTGCRYPGAGPRLSGEGRNMARKNRGCIEIILLLGSDSINLNNQRVIQMALFHGYVIGLIWITLWLFNIAMENGP